MTDVHIVVALHEGEVERCEVFSTVQVALGRAFQIANDKANSHKDWVNSSPNEEKLEDGSIRRVFLETSKQKVALYSCTVSEALLSQKDPMSIVNTPMVDITKQRDVARESFIDKMFGGWWGKSASSVPGVTGASPAVMPRGASGGIGPTGPMGVVGEPSPVSVVGVTGPIGATGYSMSNPCNEIVITEPQDVVGFPNYDSQDLKLPAGWFHNNKPALMSDLLDDPFNVRDPSFLNEDQKWALITARIRKSQKFVVMYPLGCVLDQDQVMEELKNRTSLGLKLRDAEIQALHDLREDRMLTS